MKIKIKKDCSVAGLSVKAGTILEVGLDVPERDAHVLKSFLLAEDHQEEPVAEAPIYADDVTDDEDEDDQSESEPEAEAPADQLDDAEAPAEDEIDPLTDALKEPVEAAVAPSNNTKKGSKK